MTTINMYTGQKVEVFLQVRHYENGNIGLQLWDDEGPYATLTTNIGCVPTGYAHIDTNNFPQGQDFLRAYNLGEPTEKFGISGFCTYPLWKLNLEEIRKVCNNPDELDEDMK